MLRTVLSFYVLFIGTQLLAQDENFPNQNWMDWQRRLTFKKYTLVKDR